MGKVSFGVGDKQEKFTIALGNIKSNKEFKFVLLMLNREFASLGQLADSSHFAEKDFESWTKILEKATPMTLGDCARQILEQAKNK